MGKQQQGPLVPRTKHNQSEAETSDGQISHEQLWLDFACITHVLLTVDNNEGTHMYALRGRW